jgi:hypothetical protein
VTLTVGKPGAAKVHLFATKDLKLHNCMVDIIEALFDCAWFSFQDLEMF